MATYHSNNLFQELLEVIDSKNAKESMQHFKLKKAYWSKTLLTAPIKLLLIMNYVQEQLKF